MDSEGSGKGDGMGGGGTLLLQGKRRFNLEGGGSDIITCWRGGISGGGGL